MATTQMEMLGGSPWSWIYDWACVKRNKALVEELDEVFQREEIDLSTKLSQRRLIFKLFFLTRSCSTSQDFEALATEYKELLEVVKAEKLQEVVKFRAHFLWTEIRKRTVISYLECNEPDVDSYRGKIDEFFPVRELKHLSASFRLLEERARAGLLGVMTLSPEKLVESMKNLLMKNSLHIFREVTLKRLEQLELEILGLPELQRIANMQQNLQKSNSSDENPFATISGGKKPETVTYSANMHGESHKISFLKQAKPLTKDQIAARRLVKDTRPPVDTPEVSHEAKGDESTSDTEEEPAPTPDDPIPKKKSSRVSTPGCVMRLRSARAKMAARNTDDPLDEIIPPESPRSSKEQRRLVDPHESAVQLEWTDSEAIVEYSEEEPLPAKPELKSHVYRGKRKLPQRSVVSIATKVRMKKRRQPWSNAEVSYLKEGIKRFGSGKWAQILKEFPFEGRTGVNLKDKYRNLVKKGEIAE